MGQATSNRKSDHVAMMFDQLGFLGKHGRDLGLYFRKVIKEIPIMSGFREVTSGEIGAKGTKVYEVPFAELYELNEAASTADTLGSQLSTATTPYLNIASTDAETTPGQHFVVGWAAANVDAVLFHIPLEDFDGSQNITITLRGKMSNTNNTPVVYSKIVVDEADTVVADTSDTFTSTYADHTITIAAADVPATGSGITIRLTPAAHANDLLYITSIKVEYGTLATADSIGGLLTNVSSPQLDIVNGDTDGQARILWAAGNVDPIHFSVTLEDIDTDEDMLIMLRLKMASSNDTPTISSDVYFNESDTKVEDSSAAAAQTAGNKKITIASSDIPSGACVMSCELTPGAHNTDTLSVLGAWVIYTRKFPVAEDL